MLFIERDQNGAIVAIHNNNPQKEFEQVSLKDPEVLQFLQQTNASDELMTRALAQSDSDLVRVVEDLIQLLIDRNIINFTDLPSEAQTKIRNRQTIRSRLAETDFMVDDIL